MRSINISNCCVETTDFTIEPGNPKYDELIEAGRESTKTYLENYAEKRKGYKKLRKRVGKILGV
jgi:hypothetical protein